MNDIQHQALNWETLLAVADEDLAWPLFDEAHALGLTSDPLLLHSAFYAERLGLDSSLLGDAYLALRPFYEEMDENIVILDAESEHWPRLITTRSYRSRYLYAQGDTALLSSPMASLIGTRTPTVEGRACAAKSARSLIKAGFVVLGGLSGGIEAAAHRAALNEGAPTIAVIATTHNACYPLSHMELQQEIARRGLVVSRFGPAAKNEKVHLLLRNRLMSAISSVVVVVEDRDGGTAVRQATWAGEIGKPIILFRHSLDDPALSWPKQFEKGTVVKRAQDLGRVARRLSGLKSEVKKDESRLAQLNLF